MSQDDNQVTVLTTVPLEVLAAFPPASRVEIQCPHCSW